MNQDLPVSSSVLKLLPHASHDSRFDPVFLVWVVQGLGMSPWVLVDITLYLLQHNQDRKVNKSQCRFLFLFFARADGEEQTRVSLNCTKAALPQVSALLSQSSPLFQKTEIMLLEKVNLPLHTPAALVLCLSG